MAKSFQSGATKEHSKLAMKTSLDKHYNLQHNIVIYGQKVL